MHNSADYAVYRQVISQVINDEEQLPSLPSLTLQLRAALRDPSCSQSRLSQMIMQDPALSALIMKTANSSLYTRPIMAQTLADAIRMLGMESLHDLVMFHSVKSLFVMRSPELKKLFVLGWQRQAQKTAVCILLTHLVQFKPAFLPVTACFLSELGTLAVLSAFKAESRIPDLQSYVALCKEFNKPLGTVLIRKWKLDPLYANITRNTGDWLADTGASLDVQDLVHLALYHALRLFGKIQDLPELRDLPAFTKLPPALQVINAQGLLTCVAQREDAIREYLGHF
jgi:HD-like signal output (HDOD) protein